MFHKRQLSMPLPAILMLLLATLTPLVYGQEAASCTQDGPLGMISGDIRDWQITASSTFPAKWSRGCEERHARLYGPDGYSWCAQYKGSSEWLQVDLGVEATITGIMTQGRGNERDWVTWFALSYSQDAAKWIQVLDEQGKQKVFEANADSFSVKHNYLDRPLAARLIRIHPLRYHRHPSMRIELVGCQTCKQQLALPPYARLTASSARGRRAMRNCDASYGHTMTGKAWCARKQSVTQWLQVDLGPPARVTGVVTRGRGDGKEDSWVTTYRLAYGNDGKSWAMYKDADHLSPKVFGGNHDRDSERIHFLNRPFVARYIRFHPFTWHGSIAMRVGVLGCQQPQQQQLPGAPGVGSCDSAGGFFRFSNSTRCLANLAHDKPAWIDATLGGGGGGGGGAGGAGSAAKHRKRQTDRGWDSGAWIETTTAGSGACVSLSPASTGVGWLVDLKLKQPVDGVLLTANSTTHLGFSLNRVNVFVAKRSRRDFGGGSGSGGGGGGDGGGGGGKQQMKCGSVQHLSISGSRAVHIACSKPMLGRFVYIEAHASPMVATGQSSDSQQTASLCNLRVY